MIRLVSLVLIVPSLAILGCGTNDRPANSHVDAGDPARKANLSQKNDLPPTIASLNDEVINLQNDVCAVLEGVKLKSDVQRAKDKLETINKKAKHLDDRTQKYLKEKKGEEVNMDMISWLEANEEKARTVKIRYEKAVSGLPADAKGLLEDLIIPPFSR